MMRKADKKVRKSKNKMLSKQQTENAREARASVVHKKHKRVFNRISENIGKPGKRASVRQAMVDEGYSESYAKSGLFQKTKTWGELVQDFLPDEELAITHKELLHRVSIEHCEFPKDESDKSITETVKDFGFEVIKIVRGSVWKRAYFSVMDSNATAKALDMAYKLKKKYSTDITIKNKYEKLTDEELEKKLERSLISLISHDRSGTIARIVKNILEKNNAFET